MVQLLVSRHAGVRGVIDEIDQRSPYTTRTPANRRGDYVDGRPLTTRLWTYSGRRHSALSLLECGEGAEYIFASRGEVGDAGLGRQS